MAGRIARDFQAFVRLPQRQRALLLRAAMALLLARLRLALFPASSVCRSRSVAGLGRGEVTPHEAAWAVQAVARRLPGTRCLARSLALVDLLRSSAHDLQIRFGVTPGAGGAIEAHAWVTCDGVTLEPQSAARYAQLLPARP